MSLNTWEEEFYPAPALTATVTWLDAIQHSLRKWKGILQANLDKHGVRVMNIEIVDGDRIFMLNARTCALCVKATGRRHMADCGQCPLSRSLGNRCDATFIGGDSLWLNAVHGQPQLMIDALLKAVKVAQEMDVEDSEKKRRVRKPRTKKVK